MSSSSISPTAISASDIGAVTIRGSRRGRRRLSVVRAAVAVSEDYGCVRSDAVRVGEVVAIIQGRPRQTSPFIFVVIVFFLRCLSLRPAPRACICCRSRVGLLSPLPPSACTQVPVLPWGVRPSRVPPRICVPDSSSPSSPPNLGIVRFWCPCWVAFREKARGQGASTPWQLCALVLAPHYLAMPAPFRLPISLPPFPPLPPPLGVMIPYPSVEEVWRLLPEVGVTRASSSHGRGCSACKTEGQGGYAN